MSIDPVSFTIAVMIIAALSLALDPVFIEMDKRRNVRLSIEEWRKHESEP